MFFSGENNKLFVKVRSGSGKIISVQKKTLCWLYEKKTTQVSTDRLHRFVSKKPSAKSMAADKCKFTTDEIGTGDWCIFDKNRVGHVMGFKYNTGSTREQMYTWKYAPVKPPENCSAKGISVLCVWYDVIGNSILKQVGDSADDYVDITKYKFHISPPRIKDKKLVISYQ